MQNNNYFWQANTEELKQGFYFDKSTKNYICIICGKSFEDGQIYPINNGVNNSFYTAKKAAELHITQNHGSMFEYFLNMGKTYTGLSESQIELMEKAYKGLSDKEIAAQTGAGTSAIRNRRFAINEKYKQAKITVALVQLLEDKKEKYKMGKVTEEKDMLVDIPHTAKSIDERFAITVAERNEVLGRYVDENNNLIIDKFPKKEKKKIILMQYIMGSFQTNVEYSEIEVNEIIKQYYSDYVTIRRYLIEYGFLDRKADGSKYWVKI